MKALGALTEGDVLLVTRLDRLARSTRDLLNILAAIAEKGAGFRSLNDAWADTTTAHGRLMLTILGGLAEFERELIRARTGEGRARAVRNGVKLGRKPKSVSGEFITMQPLASGTDHGNAAAKRSDQGVHGRAVVRQIVLLECCH
jgi:DNA invertase Pin-like site-specific DNA recombinase